MKSKKKKVFLLSILITLLVMLPLMGNAETVKKTIKTRKISGWGTLYYEKTAGITVKKKKGTSVTCHQFTVSKEVADSSKAQVFCILNEQGWSSSYSYSTSKCSSKYNNFTLKKLKYNDKTYDLTKVDTIRVAGKIIDIIDAKDWKAKKKYLYKTAALTILNGQSKCEYSDDGTLSEIITEAYDTVKANMDNETTFKDVKVQREKLMVKNGNDYLSKKITVTNLYKNLNEKENHYTIKIDGLEQGTAHLCTNTKANSCTAIESSGLQIPNNLINDNAVSFYIRVIGGTGEDSFKFSITSEKLDYEYTNVNVYCYSTKKQPLARGYKDTLSISATKSATLETPLQNEPEKVQHKIEISKVDTNGNPVSGAKFELSIKGTSTTLTLEENDDGTVFSYKSPTYPKDNDEFINKTYCFKETQSPPGYIKNQPSEKNCYSITTNQASSICYKQSENGTAATIEEDKNYCGAKLECPAGYDETGEVCKKVDTTPATKSCNEGFTLTDDGKCQKSTGNPMTDDQTGETTCETGTLNESDNTCYITEAATLSCGTGVDPIDGQCVTPDEKPKVCTGSEGVVDNKYCENMDSYTLIEYSDGNVYVTETNNPNHIIVSKKDLTKKEGSDEGSDEIPGAKLKICTKTDFEKNKAKCTAEKNAYGETLEWESGYVAKQINAITAGEHYIVETLPPAGYKIVNTGTPFEIDEDGKVKVGDTEVSDKTIVIDNRINDLTISKTDIATSKELPGATIAICKVDTDYKANVPEDDDSDEEDDSNADDTDDSGSSVEPNPAPGIDTPQYDDEDDEDKDENADDENADNEDFIDSAIKDKYPDMIFDVAGNCMVQTLADGSEATWVSGTEPKKISGLPAGTYYLLEITAPAGYTTAEAIKFMMREDGTLADANGKSLANNKITMNDKPVPEVKTGDILLLVFTALGLVAVGFGSYYYFNNKEEIWKKIKKLRHAN